MKKIVLVLLFSSFLILVAGCSTTNEAETEESSSYDFDSEFEKARQSASDDDLVADPDTTYVGDVTSSSSDSLDLITDSTSQEDVSSSVTREQANAFDAAEDYLDYDSFSKQGLYDQLIYEKYSADAAQYAIDNVEANWNENALQTAQDYLDFSSFSDQGLYDQLIHDKYTTEEAQYAIDNLPD